MNKSMKSRLEIWKYWCKHTQNNILYKLLVLLKLRHSPSFEFLYIRETCKEKYGYSPFAEDHIDPRLIKRIFTSYKLKESVGQYTCKDCVHKHLYGIQNYRCDTCTAFSNFERKD